MRLSPNSLECFKKWSWTPKPPSVALTFPLGSRHKLRNLYKPRPPARPTSSWHWRRCTCAAWTAGVTPWTPLLTHTQHRLRSAHPSSASLNRGDHGSQSRCLAVRSARGLRVQKLVVTSCFWSESRCRRYHLITQSLGLLTFISVKRASYMRQPLGFLHVLELVPWLV